MTAFSLLCGSLGEISNRGVRIVSALNEALGILVDRGERELLRHVIPIESEVEMPFRLLGLLTDYEDLMQIDPRGGSSILREIDRRDIELRSSEDRT